MAKRVGAANYAKNIFINCPFDNDYQHLFDAIVFTVLDCGYYPRCALEITDAAEVRIDKIFRIISDSKFGIHDISRTELDPVHSLPRFNMPLELGLFLGARQYGVAHQKKKVCLIFDHEPYRFQKFVSDIAGQDITAHENDIATLIRKIRNCLSTHSGNILLPGGDKIIERYNTFRATLPALCADLHLTPASLTFSDRVHLAKGWLSKNATA